MSISQRALGVKDMPERERPISELFRIAGVKFLAARKAFKTLDDTEKVRLARLKQKYIDQCRAIDRAAKITDAAAERHVFISEEWEEYLLHKIELDSAMGLCKLEMDELKMRHEEKRERSADNRSERYLSRG
jgi:hypothetical protein